MKAALTRYQARFNQTNTAAPPTPQVTIMGDKGTPYQTLKKIMVSCNQAGFEKISLAVLQQSPVEG
jgi:biopolymer transport protein ExbD